MELRLSLLDPRRVDSRVDVAIDASSGTPFAAVSDRLAVVVGATAGSEFHFCCDRAPIDGSQPLGLPPLVQGAVLTLASGPIPSRAKPVPSPPRPPAAVIEAHVIAGSDAGTVVPLPLGRHTIGRGGGEAIQLTDPDASRTHAQLTVSARGITVQDLDSTNGTWRGERRLGPEAEPLHPEERLRIGTALITVRRRDRPPAARTFDGAGHLRINRGPYLRPPRSEVEISFPAAPPGRSPTRIPWPTMLLPLLLAVPLAVFWRQPTFLLFALMTPALMLGQYVVDRRSGRHQAAEREARHRALTARRRQELALAVAADATYLETAHPDLARLAVTAGTPTDQLWRRSVGDAEFLALRLGRGPEPAPITVRRPSADPGGELDLRCERFVHADVPIAVNLPETRVIGICGPRRSVLGLARALIGQVSALHSPRDVQIQILSAEPGHQRDWEWVTWLPHHAGAAGSFTARVGPGDAARHRLIVLDGAHALRRRTELAAALSRAAAARPNPDAGRDPVPLLLCLDRAEPELPVECATTITLEDELADVTAAPPDASTSGPVRPGSAVLRRSGAADTLFVPDLASGRWAERLARDLAPLRDATPEPDQELPEAVRLIDLLAEVDGLRPTDAGELGRHWRRHPGPEPAAILGMAVSGPFRVDLRHDGPHLLIGGTTGAGKSELLQTLVAGLAVGSDPEAMSFLLVDYKGGAAFRESAQLPHVGGVITDLDQPLARRALSSLTAELRRRERWLRAVGAGEIDDYQRARGARPDLPALPRLVVIVDEFRVLAEELPDFVSGLVRIATVGRSLGVHLVLATQRPAGVVSADISANVNLRIALRVRDSGDSRDLIDDPAAATLPTDRPGRALASSGGGPPVAFQAALVSGRGPQTAARPPVVHRLDRGCAGQPGDRRRPADRRDPGGPAGSASRVEVSDLTLIARAATEAAGRLGLAPVRPPWVEPLPARLRLEHLLDLDATAGLPPTQRQGPVRLPFALIDQPTEQRQDVLAWQLDGSHLGISGGPRSGRTTTLHSIARSASAATGTEEMHVYVVDGAGALSHLTALRSVEAVIPVHDTERGERLLRLLRSEIDARQDIEPAEPAGIDPLDVGPDVVLLIDGWEALTSAWGAVDHGRLVDQLLSVLRDGPAVGVHAAISGGRALLTGTVSTLLTERVVLRFADPADAVLAGVPSSRVLGFQPAGRGLVLGPRFPEAAEIQVAIGGRIDQACDEASSIVLGRVSTEDARARHLIRAPAAQATWRIPELPRRLEHHRLLAAWRTQTSTGSARIDPDRRCVPIGIGGDQASVLSLDLDATTVSLVVGPPGSGRTSVLRSIAAGLARLGQPALWVSLAGFTSHPPGIEISPAEQGNSNPARNGCRPGNGIPMVDGSKPDAAATLAAALAAQPESTVLVDNTQGARVAEQAQGGLEDLLAARVGRLVVASSAPELLGAYRGLLAVVRTARSGLLLGPGAPGDGEVFGLRAERRPSGPPGRAVLIQGGRAVNLQLALPPPLPQAPSRGLRRRPVTRGPDGSPRALIR